MWSEGGYKYGFTPFDHSRSRGRILCQGGGRSVVGPFPRGGGELTQADLSPTTVSTVYPKITTDKGSSAVPAT